MATKRKYQLLAKVEDQPGVVAPSIVAAANAKILVTDPVVTVDRETYERNINRESLTPLTPLQGVRTANVSFRVELAGTSSAVGTAPDWGILLQACGFKQQTMGVLRTIQGMGSAGNGAIFSRETVTPDISGGATSEAIHDMWDGSTRYYYANPGGSMASATTITGATSGATFPVGTANDTQTHGVCWRPISNPTIILNGVTAGSGLAVGDILVGQTGGAVLQVNTISGSDITCSLLDVGNFLSASEVFLEATGASGGLTLAGSNFVSQVDWPSLTLGVIEDGVQRIVKGCRGSVTFSANIGEPVFMDFEFRGLISSDTDGVLGATVSPTALVPPSFLEISYGVAKNTPLVAPADEHAPCISSWSLEFRNEIEIERCAGSTGGVRGPAFATGRACTGSIDPSVRPEASFPWLDVYKEGTIFRQRITVGDTAKNQFHMSLPASQITSEGAGDRNGLGTRDFQYSASGQNPAGNDGEDREFVLSLHQSTTFTR
jgi:hypothetical protein